MRAYNSRTDGALNLRDTAQIAAFFDGLQILEPGVVHIARWRAPGADTGAADEGGFYGGVGCLAA